MDIMEKKNIYQKINTIKKELSEREIKKSGHNKHLNFNYHELSDFLSVITSLNEKHGVNEKIDITSDISTLTLTNVDNPEETQVTTVQTVMAEMQPKNDPIQKLGATITYIRRYLYLIAYSITDHDVIDAQNLKEESTKITAEENKSAIDKLKLYVKNQVSDKVNAGIVITNSLAKHGFTKLDELDFNKVDKKLFLQTLNKEINDMNQSINIKKDEESF